MRTQRLRHRGLSGLGIALDRGQEQPFLVAVALVEAGAWQAHLAAEAGEAGAVIAMGPEHAHCGVKRLLRRDAAGAATGTGVACGIWRGLGHRITDLGRLPLCLAGGGDPFKC